MRVIEGQWWLDTPSYKIEHGIGLMFNLLGPGSGPVQNFLHGTVFGHPLHPLITDVPVGSWTAALALDAIGLTRRHRRPALADAARSCIGVGVAGAVGAAITGTADWQHTQENARRVGLVHGVLNAAALGLYAMSWNERRRGRHTRGRQLSLLGFPLVFASGYLGGNLVFRHRVGVDHSDKGVEPRQFTPTVPVDELEHGKPTRVECAGVNVVLVRDGERVFAVGEHCPHMAAPMNEGWLYRGELVCPWHGSRFAPDGGTPAKGPATAPLTCYETRVRAGRVEVRRLASSGTAPPESSIGGPASDEDVGR